MEERGSLPALLCPLLRFGYGLSPLKLMLRFNPHCETLAGGTSWDLEEVIRLGLHEQINPLM